MRNRTGSLLLTGGTVIGVDAGTRTRTDVAFANGRISAVTPDLPREGYEQVVELDAEHLVLPGLIDLHGHFYNHAHPGGVDPDRACLPFGVTTAVDAGSCGWATFNGFRRFTVPAARTKLFAFLNLSAVGTLPIAASGVGELKDLGYIQSDDMLACLAANGDRIVGIKVRLATDCIPEGMADQVLGTALDLAERSGLPLMVHVSDSPMPVTALLTRLRRGDIVTHVFNGSTNNLAHLPSSALDAYLDAQRRGIVFDVAHAGKHFDRAVARAALTRGFVPDTISTDMHYPRPGFSAPSLIDVANELLDLGMGVDDVLRGLTRNPARVLAPVDRWTGRLEPGAAGDAVVLRLVTGPSGTPRIEVDLTVVDAEPVSDARPYGDRSTAVRRQGRLRTSAP
jgi:dihydroorotase